MPKFKHVGANANQIERITQDYQKIGEILEEQQISLNEIENVVRKSRQNENEKLDLLKKRIEYNVKKHTKISYEEIYDDRFFHSYFL